MDKKHWHASSGTMHPSVQRRWGLAFTHCRALLINDYVVHGSNADLAVLNEIRIEILNIDCPHRFAEGGHRGSGGLPGSTRRHGGCLNPAAQLEFLQLKYSAACLTESACKPWKTLRGSTNQTPHGVHAMSARQTYMEGRFWLTQCDTRPHLLCERL